jgi:hypothetical protein
VAIVLASWYSCRTADQSLDEFGKLGLQELNLLFKVEFAEVPFCEIANSVSVSVDFAGFVVVMKVAAFFRIERISARDTCFRVA